jgi:hypothetical protein
VLLVAGGLAPALFLVGLVVASRTERAFMGRADWGTWPSGLGLGPHGWLYAASSVLLGLGLLTFAAALRRSGVSGVSTYLYALAGIGALLFALDPDLRYSGDHVETGNPFTATTTRGVLHGIGFFAFAPAMLAANILLWRRLRRLEMAPATRRRALVGLALFLPVVALPAARPISGYLVLCILLAPLTAMAARMTGLPGTHSEL